MYKRQDKNGLIDLSVDLSFPPYQVLWPHDSSLVGLKADNLLAGEYKIEVTDNYGESKIMNFSIEEPDELNVTLISVENTLCADSKDGNVDLYVSGGTGSYYYDWNDLSIPQIKNPSLGQGSYELKVSDMNGCFDTVNLEIESPDSLEMIKYGFLNDTSNMCEGELSVITSGGVSPYSYFTDGEINSFENTFENLCKGIIDITVKDANGCELTDSFEIKAPDIHEAINSVDDILSYFIFYPNPSDKFILAEFNLLNNKLLGVSIVDATSKIMQLVKIGENQSNSYKIAINTSHFTSGTYYLNVKTSHGISSKQFQVYHLSLIHI